MRNPISFPHIRRLICIHVIVCFILNNLNLTYARAQDYVLPAPGVRVGLSPEFNPPILKGLKVHPDNPFRFDFIMDKGDSPSLVQRGGQGELKQEANRLIKYFLASLTIPENDLWVNLSPYEKDRIIPPSFGLTEMGRDLLAEDYMLKQITASLIYPEGEVGKRFWRRVYEEAAKKFSTTNIPVNTFNKVWIVPEKAVVYENAQAGTAYVVESKLKVMLEEDYLSIKKHTVETPFMASHTSPFMASLNRDAINRVSTNNVNALGSNIVREIVIPELTKEVNEDKNFARLRQVYNSLILATWYKKKIKDSILSQVYADKNKIVGVNIDDPQEKQRIYERYLRAFKKGAFNYIKDDTDALTQQPIPRKYFSGGVVLGLIWKPNAAMAVVHTVDAAQLPADTVDVTTDIDSATAEVADNEPTLSDYTAFGDFMNKLKPAFLSKTSTWNETGHAIEDATASPNGRYLYVKDHIKSTAFIKDMYQDRILVEFETYKVPHNILYSENGRYLVYKKAGSFYLLWLDGSNNVPQELNLGDTYDGKIFIKNNVIIVASEMPWNGVDRKLKPISVMNPETGILYRPNFISDNGHWVAEWIKGGYKITNAISGETYSIKYILEYGDNKIVLSDDGDIVFNKNNDEGFMLFNKEFLNGKFLLFTLRNLYGEYQLNVSKGTVRIVSRDTVYDLNEGKEILQFEGHDHSRSTLSKDGKYLIQQTLNGQVHFTEIESKKPFRAFYRSSLKDQDKQNFFPTTDVDVLPGGNYALIKTGNVSAETIIHDLSTGEFYYVDTYKEMLELINDRYFIINKKIQGVGTKVLVDSLTKKELPLLNISSQGGSWQLDKQGNKLNAVTRDDVYQIDISFFGSEMYQRIHATWGEYTTEILGLLFYSETTVQHFSAEGMENKYRSLIKMFEYLKEAYPQKTYSEICNTLKENLTSISALFDVYQHGHLDMLFNAGIDRKLAIDSFFNVLPTLWSKNMPNLYEAIKKLLSLGFKPKDVLEFYTDPSNNTVEKITNVDVLNEEMITRLNIPKSLILKLFVSPIKDGSLENFEKLISDPSLKPGSRQKLIDILQKRLKPGYTLKEQILALRTGLALFGDEKLIKFLDAKDDDRTIESMVLDLYHKDIFQQISQFIDNLRAFHHADQVDIFLRNIIAQVPQQKGVDSNGEGSHRQLSNVIKKLLEFSSDGQDWQERLALQSKGNIITETLYNELFAMKEGKPFWLLNLKEFKRLGVLINLIVNQEVVKKIEEYKNGSDDDKKVYAYYYNLLTHAQMEDFVALRKMVLEPRAFLDLDDANSEKQLHNVKKPSRLLDTGYIDLEPEELIRAMILGKLNAVQAMPDFSKDIHIEDFDPHLTGPQALLGGELVNYLLENKYINKEDLKVIMQQLLKAESERLYRQKASQADQLKVANAKKALNSMPIEKAIKQIGELSFDLQALKKYGLTFTEFRIRIIPKSDPQAIMTGSEAPSCMKFGSGKNNIYMFNPNTLVLALSKKSVNDEGKPIDRIVATSVLTLDRKIPQNFVALKTALEEFLKTGNFANMDLQKFFGDKFIDEISTDVTLAVDNIEAAPNTIAKGEGAVSFDTMVQGSYKQFFEDYFKQYKQSRSGREVVTNRVVMGIAHDDVSFKLGQIPNKFLGQAPVAYTDKHGENVLELKLDTQALATPVKPLQGILPLSYEDTLEVAYIENKAFAGQDLKNHLAGIEMELTAATYNEAIKGDRRKNLSLGYYQNGRLQGYVIAYVGFDKERKKEVIYISDLAVLKKGSPSAHRILNALFKSIRETVRNFRIEYKTDLQVLFHATTYKEGSFRLFMPYEGDTERMIRNKEERLKSNGLSFEEPKKLDDGRVEFLMSVDKADAPNPEDVIDGTQVNKTDGSEGAADPAQNTGGIDLTPANMNVQIKTGSPTKAFGDDTGVVRNGSEGIQFNLDPAMLAQLQNAPGFVPVIINIQPMKDLQGFLGLSAVKQAAYDEKA